MGNDTIDAIASEVGQPTSAVVIRWHIQCGLSTIPKASSRDHIEANFKALDFELTDDQMKKIDDLDDPDGRMGPEPGKFNS